MVENLEEWVADWVPQTTACGRWNNRTSPTGRLISALPVRAPPVTRMRCSAAARGNSPRGAVRSRSVDNRRRTTVSASASAARGSHARVGPFAVCTLVSRGWAASSRRPAGAVRAARVSERHGLTRLVPIDNGSTTPRSRLAKSARGTVERDAAVKAVEASHVLPHDGSEQRPLIRVLVVGAERASNLQVPPVRVRAGALLRPRHVSSVERVFVRAPCSAGIAGGHEHRALARAFPLGTPRAAMLGAVRCRVVVSSCRSS